VVVRDKEKTREREIEGLKRGGGKWDLQGNKGSERKGEGEKQT